GLLFQSAKSAFICGFIHAPPQSGSSITITTMTDDTIARARRRYAVERWSEGHFDIDESGRLLALPDRARRLAVVDIVERARADGLRLPMLLRFPDVLRSRARQ